MFRKKGIQPLLDDRPPMTRSGGAVDHIAAGTGAFILSLGIAGLVSPFWIAPLTGIEPGSGGAIVASQWAVFGTLLLAGGVLRTRVVTIFASEFVMISALVALAITLVNQPDWINSLIHGSMAFLGLISSGFARLTDKADLKRELLLMRERANSHAGNNAKSLKEQSKE